MSKISAPIKKDSLNTLEIFVHLASFAMLTYLYVPYSLRSLQLDFTSLYWLALQLSGITLYMLVFVSLVLLLSNKSLPLIRNTLLMIASLTGLGCAYLGFGLIQDILGISCGTVYGFNVSCLSNASSQVLTIAQFQGFLLPGTAVFGMLLIIGIYKSLYINVVKSSP